MAVTGGLLTRFPAALAMSAPTGFKPNDPRKRVAIGHAGYDANPCNMHLADLAEKVQQNMPEDIAGLKFGTIGVSDGISMGTYGMKFSLLSRDLIADSVETQVGSYSPEALEAIRYQGLIIIPGCDKNMPGMMMGAARRNLPTIMLYGGTIRAGKHPSTNADLDVVSAFQVPGNLASGKIDEKEALQICMSSCPGAGACGGMYTANTMSSAIEALGMSLPGSSSTPAEEKERETWEVGRAISHLIDRGIKPRDIMTKEAFYNGMAVAMATGGSTNIVLHFIAMAQAAGIKLTVDDFQKVSNEVPYIVNMKPSGPYVMERLHQRGGIPALMKYMLHEGLLDGKQMTVTGKTLEENLEYVKAIKPDQDLVYSFAKPLKSTGHIQILRGNLAPTSAVGKITGKEGLYSEGRALVFNSEEEYTDAWDAGTVAAKIKENDTNGEKTAVVIRYEGPKGGPGMREMLYPTSSITGAGLGDKCLFLTDGRFSGGSTGFVIGHVTPEAHLGGPIALVKDGDPIRVDVKKNSIDLLVDQQELEQRRSQWQAPHLKIFDDHGNRIIVLEKYARDVKPAYEGCVTI